MTWWGWTDGGGRRWVGWESAWYDVGGFHGQWHPGGYEYVSLEGVDCFAAWVRS